ncbi:hypothetical protein PM082_000663 [Marasmius tenuissimus]|nr:hypothetical protein PM082_000663 [Marasmius tenuissimus]
MSANTTPRVCHEVLDGFQVEALPSLLMKWVQAHSHSRSYYHTHHHHHLKESDHSRVTPIVSTSYVVRILLPTDRPPPPPLHEPTTPTTTTTNPIFPHPRPYSLPHHHHRLHPVETAAKRDSQHQTNASHRCR